MTKPQPYSEYKDVGVDWLGSVPSHWEIRPLGTCFDERRETVSDKEFAPLSVTMNGIVPQLETAAKTDNGDNRKRVNAGDFVINSRSDRKGSAGVSELEGSVSVISTVITARTGISTRFIHHLLRSQPFQEEYYRFGTGIVADLWSTRYSSMKRITLALPTPAEQARIASFLDRETAQIDELIGKQERLIELLAEKRQAIITHAVTKGLDPNTPIKEVNLGWTGAINSKWPVIPLKRAGRVTLGKMLQSEQKDPRDLQLPYLRAANIQPHGLAVEDRQLMWFTESEQTHLSLRSGDVVVVEGGAGFGRSDVLSNDLVGWAFQNSINRVRPFPEFDGRFIDYVLKAINATDFNDVVCNKATIPHLTAEKLERHLLAAPQKPEQERIADFLDFETERITALTSKARNVVNLLHERRSALISAAVTGKIDVREGVA